ncbi:MAG: hypothetical protein NWE85_04735 [Candidatus Bathyarchaeota archaeon]|nr:hypothetical protein [Candidatus Bathyarchaeota archaeon]
MEYKSACYPFSALSFGFTLTYVKNIKLERLEEDLESLSESFTELQQNCTRLEGNYTELKGKYDELSESSAGVEYTRQVMMILAITTIVFAATTIYFFMRKPKRSL